MTTVLFGRATRVEGRWIVRVRCPLCGRRHTHGQGDGSRRPPMNLGHRGAHCGRGGYEVIVRNGEGNHAQAL